MSHRAQPMLQFRADLTTPQQPKHARAKAKNLGEWSGNQSRLRKLANPAPQRGLAIGSVNDSLEAEADRVADYVTHRRVARRIPQLSPAVTNKQQSPAPASVHQELRSPGRPLDHATRTLMESGFGYDLSRVQIHAGSRAAASANAIGARAYTVGSQIVFGAGEYTPATHAGSRLIAHELTHVIQQNTSPVRALVQRQPIKTSKPSVPRQDYVFIMGADPKGTRNPFFTYAKIYFKAHLPHAIFVEDKRTLTDLLDWISLNINVPIGNLYIVSHGNEDGTLFFGLDSSKANTNVVDLREALHPAAGGSTTLTSVSSVIDSKTKIHIKGCDIGRTREMVELIDEAFGGKGTVNAPTHEQGYFTDPTLGAEERRKEHDKRIADFTSTLPPLPAAPPPVDRKLKGDALKQARKDHDAAVAAFKKARIDRTKDLAAEEKLIKPDLKQVEKEAGIVDTLSGPMFQRPGTTPFTAADLKPEIDRLYPHLSESQRKDLGARLVKADRGNPSDQQGQKIDRRIYSETYDDPESVREAVALYRKFFDSADNFDQPRNLTTTFTGSGPDKKAVFTVTGSAHPRHGTPLDNYTWTSDPEPVPDEKAFLTRAKSKLNNPNRFQWSVERTHNKFGVTTLTATAKRVIAYLHHAKLDRSAHEHFTEPENNPDFYATSTFAPPPPT
ncbi:MAG TPA: DUF4157 domain-containing protein, partial [Candidatus Sulfotelmatobacter sp.]|nr:DUF4157 domain-containing protein [Candidatus Sulfotelmatobacter sp.]